MAEEITPELRAKRTRGGVFAILCGIVGGIGIFLYYRNSLDPVDSAAAMPMALAFGLIWGLFGLGLIIWYNRDPRDRGPFADRDDRDMTR